MDIASTLPPTGQADDSTSVGQTESRTADQLLADAASDTGTTSAADKPTSRNLFEDPNFRKVQSQYEKRMAEQARRIAELEAKQEEVELADLDDTERIRYERDKLARQLEELRQADTIQQQRRTILSELSEKSGVPVDVLGQADSAYDAALLAVEYLKKNGTERREASKVDLGGGRANTPSDRYETAAREAVANKDPVAYIRLLREANG